MIPLWAWLLGGAGVAWWLARPATSAPSPSAVPASWTSPVPANVLSQAAFMQQAYALGLTQWQAQQAWDIGLTPSEYLASFPAPQSYNPPAS